MAKIWYSDEAQGYTLYNGPIDFKTDGYYYVVGGAYDRALAKCKTIQETRAKAIAILERTDNVDVLICVKRVNNKPRWYPGWEIPARKAYMTIGLVELSSTIGEGLWTSENWSEKRRRRIARNGKLLN